MIPKNIFQTWKTKPLTEDLENIMKTWIKMNPSYSYKFYDDNDCIEFMKNFDQRVYRAYKKIIPGAFKADLWRYCVLFEFGGFYCDVDTICVGSIDYFLDETIDFTSPIDIAMSKNYEYNLFNAFIGSKAKSKVMKNCIERVVYNVENMIVDINPLDFSACGVLGRALNCTLGNDETKSFFGKEGKFENYYLFKFNKDGEFVGDNFGNNLFQNKNGNEKIKKIYEKECKINKVESWSKNKKWISNIIFL